MADTITVSATKMNVKGKLLVNGLIRFQSVTSSGDEISVVIGDGGGLELLGSFSAFISNGVFTINLPDTTKTNPSNIGFKVTVKNLDTSEMVLGPGYECYQPSVSGTTFDLVPPNVPRSLTVQYGPPG